MTSLQDRVLAHLQKIYPGRADMALVHEVVSAVGLDPDASHPASPSSAQLSEAEVVLITYGNTVARAGDVPLQTLAGFVDRYLDGVISTVHVLPFFPSSSDGGFAVVDHAAVAPELGEWPDIAALATGNGSGPRGLMVDLIVNHGSAGSEWFQQFLADEAPGRDYFTTIPAGADVSTVVRPRTHDLAQTFVTAVGERHVWCTFSRDQVDFDFANPDVLVEFCRIVDLYVRHGSTRIRLDAVGYVWKEFGTESIHLPQTHELVKLMRTLLSRRAPETLIITETNVPHDQNVSYFGDGDEAHVVYNFSLVPLVLHSVLSGSAEALTDWAATTAPAPEGAAFLNFLASHDGLGLRPAEGLLTTEQIAALVDRGRAVGGDCSSYSTPDGERPYELNVSLADLLLGADHAQAEDQDVDRFVLAHAIMCAFQGIPAFYVHSLLATPGDTAAVRASGHKRDINRPQLQLAAVEEALADSASITARVLDRLRDLVRVRRVQPAFSPAASQDVLQLGDRVLALRRTTEGQTLVALHNVSGHEVDVDAAVIHAALMGEDLSAPPVMRDVLSDEPAGSGSFGPVSLGPEGQLRLDPYRALWLVAGD